MMRRLTAHSKGGEGLNLGICVLRPRAATRGGEGLNPDVHAKELLTRLLHVTKSKQRREARSPKLGDPIVLWGGPFEPETVSGSRVHSLLYK